MPASGNESLEFTDLPWWTSHPAELAEARRLAEADAAPGGLGAGIGEGGGGQARLTLTVEEAAQRLSRILLK